jgi:hypothetical protein
VTHLQHFSRYERAQQKFNTSGVGSLPSFAAQSTNGRYAEK